MHKIYIVFLVFILFSCTSKLRYVGQKFPAVKNVDVFVTEYAIKQPFTVIGKGYMSKFGFIKNPEKIQQKAIAKGQDVGADAVIIIDYYIPDTGGTVINTIIKTDSVGKGLVTAGNTTISPTSSSGYSIIFVKYNR